MPKQTCRRVPLLFALPALAAIGFWPAMPAAQHGAPDVEAPEEALKDGESGAPALPERTPAERLDDLYAELAEADAGEHERVEKEIERLWARSGSDSMDLLLQRGRDAMGEQELVKAIHHFTALVEHAPDFAEGWNARATAFFLRGDLGQSLADIERALALDPRHFGALYGLGVILEQLGWEDDALIAYREALQVNPNMESALKAEERLAPDLDGRDI